MFWSGDVHSPLSRMKSLNNITMETTVLSFKSCKSLTYQAIMKKNAA